MRVFILALSIILLCAFSVHAENTLKVSWLPAESGTVPDGYEIYCDIMSVNDVGFKSHEYWKDALFPIPESNGRLYYTWKEFPLEAAFCVAVSYKTKDGKRLSSDFSNEVEVIFPDDLQPPIGLQTESVVIINIY